MDKMKMFLLALAGSLCLMGGSIADEKKDKKTEETKKKLIGVWEAQEGGALPAGSTLEFMKDGKFKAIINELDKKATRDGTYEIEGETLKATHQGDGKEVVRNLKIIKLSDKELALMDEDQDKTATFKRKAK
jgi:uncharacterized protein (TIGR03066 family)